MRFYLGEITAKIVSPDELKILLTQKNNTFSIFAIISEFSIKLVNLVLKNNISRSLISKDFAKTIISYCSTTVFISIFIILGVFVESYETSSMPPISPTPRALPTNGCSPSLCMPLRNKRSQLFSIA